MLLAFGCIDVSIIDLNCASYRDKDYEKVLRQKKITRRGSTSKPAKPNAGTFIASTDGSLQEKRKLSSNALQRNSPRNGNNPTHPS
jgi:hypothetical protein